MSGSRGPSEGAWETGTFFVFMLYGTISRLYFVSYRWPQNFSFIGALARLRLRYCVILTDLRSRVWQNFVSYIRRAWRVISFNVKIIGFWHIGVIFNWRPINILFKTCTIHPWFSTHSPLPCSVRCKWFPLQLNLKCWWLYLFRSYYYLIRK